MTHTGERMKVQFQWDRVEMGAHPTVQCTASAVTHDLKLWLWHCSIPLAKFDDATKASAEARAVEAFADSELEAESAKALRSGYDELMDEGLQTIGVKNSQYFRRSDWPTIDEAMDAMMGPIERGE